MTRAPASGNPRDTIFAIATGAGRAAITVMRISGAEAGRILSELAGRLPVPRRASLRDLRDPAGALLDRALVLWLPGPSSYTGEDSAELHLHGGRAVGDAVTSALLHAGARPADAGEFTRRAFLAGRMDLLEAEAIADLAAAETESQRALALVALQGKAGIQLQDWSDRLTHCLALQEALIDFPDETADDAADHRIAAELRRLVAEIEAHLGRARAGACLRGGIVVAIAGAPNVGKSSLFNNLAERDMAMVSPLPGTTRDVLEARIDLAGIAVTLVDTAGLRETEDVLEAEGVRRARSRAASADLVLHMTDRSTPRPDCGPDCDNDRIIWVESKIDLAPPRPGSVGLSTRTGDGVDALVSLLSARAIRLTRADGDPIFSKARHVAALRDARQAVAAASEADLPELRAEDLRAALCAIGRLTGRVDADEVLDIVFGAFCIGK